MNSIEKRIKELERRTAKKPEGAWLAFIEENEAVHLSHIKHEDIYLNSREELNEFIDANNMQDFDLIIVDYAHCQGKPPEEL